MMDIPLIIFIVTWFGLGWYAGRCMLKPVYKYEARISGSDIMYALGCLVMGYLALVFVLVLDSQAVFEPFTNRNWNWLRWFWLIKEK
jgi:hypothetical protein